jgi:hypothetical protein
LHDSLLAGVVWVCLLAGNEGKQTMRMSLFILGLLESHRLATTTILGSRISYELGRRAGLKVARVINFLKGIIHGS